MESLSIYGYTYTWNWNVSTSSFKYIRCIFLNYDILIEDMFISSFFIAKTNYTKLFQLYSFDTRDFYINPINEWVWFSYCEHING